MHSNYNSLQYKRRNSRKYNSVEHHYFSIPELEQLLSLESSLNEEQLNRQSWQEYWNWYVVLDFFFLHTNIGFIMSLDLYNRLQVIQVFFDLTSVHLFLITVFFVL